MHKFLHVLMIIAFATAMGQLRDRKFASAMYAASVIQDSSCPEFALGRFYSADVIDSVQRLADFAIQEARRV